MQASAAKTIGELGAVELQPDLVATLDKSQTPKTTIEVAAALAKLSHPRGPEDAALAIATCRRAYKNRVGAAAGGTGRTRCDGAFAKATEVNPADDVAALLALVRGGDSQAAGKLRQLFDGKAPAAEKPRIAFQLARLGDGSARDWLEKRRRATDRNKVKATRFLAQLGDVVGPRCSKRTALTTNSLTTRGKLPSKDWPTVANRKTRAAWRWCLVNATLAADRYTTAGAILLFGDGKPASRQRNFRSAGPSRHCVQTANRRELAVLLLGSQSSGASLDALRNAMTDKSTTVRKSAVGALAERGGKDALLALQAGLSDGEKDVRVAAAEAIGRVSSAMIGRGEADAARPMAEKSATVAEQRRTRTDGSQLGTASHGRSQPGRRRAQRHAVGRCNGSSSEHRSGRSRRRSAAKSA